MGATFILKINWYEKVAFSHILMIKNKVFVYANR